jgi:Tol biopolymer transport system component
MIGSRLGPYEVAGKLGEGGMGEVWRATDSRLKRDVALKVLPAAFTADAERLARFEREAQVLAQLHHSNIASIFGLEEADGTRALVMELVEGPTLAERLAAGPLPVEDALAVALQIAQALEEAHGKGIVHRDLKPQNVKAPAGGTVKVLDFGLAKAMEGGGGAASGGGPLTSPTLMNSPTLTAVHGTQLGTILGTAAYMAPEQAKGMAADRRADIWAFGVVLYEMLAGGSLFAGDSVGDTLAAVIRAEIDLGRLPAATPHAIRGLIRRCLERNPRNRLHDIADARIVLEEVLAGRSDEPATGPAGRSAAPAPRRRWLLAAAGLAAGLALGIAIATLWLGRADAESIEPPLTRLEVQLPEGAGLVRGLSISPDGRRLAFAARGADGRIALWVRPLDALEARQLPGTEGARYPFWAPDSRRVAYFSPRGLAWTDTEGGAPLEVAQTSSIENVRGGAWGADDVILYTPHFTGPILAVPAKGGASAPATRLTGSGEMGTTRFPSFLPDGHRFVFYASAGTGTEPGTLHLGRVGSLEAKLLGPANSAALYAAPGYLLYARGDAIVAHRFDDRRGELVGTPQSLGITMGSSLNVSGLRSIAVARGGMLLYRNDRRGTTELVTVDRAGRELEGLESTASTWHYAPRLSPDERSLAVSHLDVRSGFGEIWVHDLARRLAVRLTLGTGDDYMPTWLPGGREIIYASTRTTPGDLYRVALERPGEGRLWVRGTTYQGPCTVTPDGKRLVFERADAQGRTALWVKDLDGDAEATRLGSGTAAEFSADVSPDGRWLAYVSDATREWEVYVRRLDGSGGAIRISPDGGMQPLWRKDGRELFYLDPRGRLVAVPIVPGEPLQPGAAEPLFAAGLEEATDRQYDAFADGQRFVLNRTEDADSSPLLVVLDWRALLARSSP